MILCPELLTTPAIKYMGEPEGLGKRGFRQFYLWAPSKSVARRLVHQNGGRVHHWDMVSVEIRKPRANQPCDYVAVCKYEHRTFSDKMIRPGGREV